SFVSDRECLTIVPSAPAHVAENVNVRKKIHLDAFETFALAGFTAAALDVERKAPGLVTALARLRQHRVELANRREQSGVGSGIRSWGAADGRLVDLDHLVHVLQSFD